MWEALRIRTQTLLLSHAHISIYGERDKNAQMHGHLKYR